MSLCGKDFEYKSELEQEIVLLLANQHPASVSVSFVCSELKEIDHNKVRKALLELSFEGKVINLLNEEFKFNKYFFERFKEFDDKLLTPVIKAIHSAELEHGEKMNKLKAKKLEDLT